MPIRNSYYEYTKRQEGVQLLLEIIRKKTETNFPLITSEYTFLSTFIQTNHRFCSHCHRRDMLKHEHGKHCNFPDLHTNGNILMVDSQRINGKRRTGK